MRLQLRPVFSFIVTAVLLLRSAGAWAQSFIKLKHLNYSETSPGIVVNEDSLDVHLEQDNQDQWDFLGVSDAVTGASPTGVPASAAGTVTGASAAGASNHGTGEQYSSFWDHRLATTLGYSPLLNPTTRLNLAVSGSEERDYKSTGLTMGVRLELNKKNTVLTPSLTVYDDRVLPTNGKPDGTKRTEVYSVGLSQVIDPWDVAGLSLGVTQSQGMLSDPYKQVQVGTSVVSESRPDSRTGVSVGGSWRRMPFKHEALDLQLTLYGDDWGVDSVSTKVTSLTELNNHWVMDIFLRLYNQSAAKFWARSFPAGNTDAYRSADPRLGAFTSTTLGLDLTYKLSDAWWIEGSLASYVQYSKLLGVDPSSGRVSQIDTLASASGGGGSDGEGGEGGGGFGPSLSAVIYSIAAQFRF